MTPEQRASEARQARFDRIWERYVLPILFVLLLPAFLGGPFAPFVFWPAAVTAVYCAFAGCPTPLEQPACEYDCGDPYDPRGP